MTVMINNVQEKHILHSSLEDNLQKLVGYLLHAEGISSHVEISIVLVDNKYIAGLNESYRCKKEATDVLSFNLQDELPGVEKEKHDQVLGDVLISVEKAFEQAGEAKKTLEEEILFLTAHGVLHLMGYEHESPQGEEEMQRKKEYALAYLKQGRKR